MNGKEKEEEEFQFRRRGGRDWEEGRNNGERGKEERVKLK